MPLSAKLPPELLQCAEAAWDKKALDLTILDLRELSDVTDYFVICHGSSSRQVQAIADSIDGALRKEFKLRPANIEGRSSADWILMDYIDFVIHVFVEEKRGFYRLERLWGDAVDITPEQKLPPDRLAQP